ncbi:DUF2852 domain-containing protein [Frigidibacter sp. ROC022]|uniref:DUF2852 domain-containing protein n=1 Tax=Frigidibacter sp. ROC022 TaxID=2971796 RepID=UPI00215A88CF|nr:DUF2852 domain-containing protein [Frigidibacter sp. ROC022]MCR8723793.1 DUF2852 domain-containing protein [Frigidibacter sp. ROC022]
MGHRDTRTEGLYRWFTRAENWLDERGKGAWIALMILGFVFVWPLGLALLAYMIWSKRMFSGSCAFRGGLQSHRRAWKARQGFNSTGNTAFDSYKADTLRRLEEEQEAFEAFLQRLRDAKDKSEFDAFMEDRAARARAKADSVDDDATPA